MREKDKELFSHMRFRMKPSSREKKRYIVFEIISEHEFNFEEVKKAVMSNCLRYLGEFGYEKLRLYIIKNLYNKNKGMLRVTNKMLNDIKASLAKINQINGKKAALKIIGISGILKKAKNKFLIL